MSIFCRLVSSMILALLAVPVLSQATSFELNAVTYPERKTIKLGFTSTERAPRAVISAKVNLREGQAQIKIDFAEMKPAVLFGGDVTCYVVWAVSRDGSYANLGELWMPENKGQVEFSSGRKVFALLVTAESYAMVERPSDLLMFYNKPAEPKKAPSTPFEFSGFGEAPERNQDSVANIAWDSTVPLDLMQAEKAYELAQRHGAEQYAGTMMRGALIALGQARNMVSKTKSRNDYSRRSIALSSDAIQITVRRKEAKELARQIAARRAEMEGLEERARESEQRSAEAREALLKAQQAISEANDQQSAAEAAVLESQAELARIGEEKNKMEVEHARLVQEKAAMELEHATMLTSLESMREEGARLRKEREELSNRLKGALSQVAETHDSARGMIVNLPDILFDSGKAALKQAAQLVIAKLAGILLIMPELNLRVEGHTDATGADDFNQKLSEDRAQSVKDFLFRQSIADDRMTAVGYGEDRPVADNANAAGRKQNRRVEIIIAQGEIAEAPAAAE